MKKAINLQAQLHCGPDQDRQQLGADLESTFARVNPGMQLTVKSLSPPDGTGNVTVRVYIEGEQEPAAPFAPLANGALHKAIAALVPGPQGTTYGVRGIQEVEDDDDTGLVLPPQHVPASAPDPAGTPSPGPPTGAPAQAGGAPAPHPAPPSAAASAARPEGHAAAADSSGSDYAAVADTTAANVSPPTTETEASAPTADAASASSPTPPAAPAAPSLTTPGPKGSPGNPRGSSERHRRKRKGGGHSHSG